MALEHEIARRQLEAAGDPLAESLQLPYGQGFLDYFLKPALALLFAPHEYITRPLVVEPAKSALEWAMPGITAPQEVPITSQLPEAPWQPGAEQITMTAPGAGTVFSEALGGLADIPVYGQVARTIAEVAQMGKPGWGRFLREEEGLIRPRVRPVETPSTPELWEGQQPLTTEWQNLERMPGLAKQKKDLFTGPSLPNPRTDELVAAYGNGLITDLNQIEKYFKEFLNRDQSGKSIFENQFQRQVDLRREYMKHPEYTPSKQSVSAGRKNIKTEGEVVPLDCSRGCVGFCPECYMQFGKQGIRAGMFPKEVELVGHVTKAKDGHIYRLGEMGEPGFNPISWKQTEPIYRDLMKSDKPFSVDDLWNLTEQHYDWSYFNNQLKKTGLDAPKGLDRTYVVSKLQGLNNFDPHLVKNLEVSLDTLTPDHFFRSLKNIETLLSINPNYNIMLRPRSIATSNPEINALQKIVVDFANKYNIPVLETRLRFKHKAGAEMAEVLPEYIRKGNQYVHQSYYPSGEPELSKATTIKKNNTEVMSYQAHTPDGPLETGVYLTRGEGNNWEIWQPDGTLAGIKPKDEAKELGLSLAKMYGQGFPTKQTIWEINRNESPLSQFGLNPRLHYQCNTYNVSGAACKECGSCRAFTQMETARAK